MLPMVTSTDLSEQEAFDHDSIPFATPRDKNDSQETNDPPAITTSPQPQKAFIPPTSFYAKPSEKKEKQKPLWVSRVLF